MNTEKVIIEVVAKARARARGDISDALYEGGAISKEQHDSLKKRDPHWTGNPIDQKETFFKQNPN